MITGAKKIIGKTIAGVVVKESDHFPKSQVFLIFSDNTSFEFYSDESEIRGNTDIQPYGLEGVKTYISRTHRIVQEFYSDLLAR